MGVLLGIRKCTDGRVGGDEEDKIFYGTGCEVPECTLHYDGCLSTTDMIIQFNSVAPRCDLILVRRAAFFGVRGCTSPKTTRMHRVTIL